MFKAKNTLGSFLRNEERDAKLQFELQFSTFDDIVECYCVQSNNWNEASAKYTRDILFILAA